MPLGILLILLGWLGASHTPFAFEQTPYLISGGILGLALTISGGFVYFAYWQTVRIRESRQQAEDLSAAVGRPEGLLPGGAGRPGLRAGKSASGSLVAAPNGAVFQPPECAHVAGPRHLHNVH